MRAFEGTTKMAMSATLHCLTGCAIGESDTPCLHCPHSRRYESYGAAVLLISTC